MLAFALLATVPILLWLGQSAILLVCRQPLRWRLGASGLPHRVRQANRVMTNVVLAGVVIAYPLLRGASPLAYYGAFLPLNAHAAKLVQGTAASISYLAPLYIVWILTDNVRVRVRHGAARLARRLAVVPLAAILGAGVEELLFRAVLLAGLLESFPTPLAVALGTILFAAAHYVREVKRYWTFAGHLALGLLLCVAFVCTGTIWLSIGLHAGGILLLSGLRPFVRYRGPAWLVGASIFPYASVTGVIGLGLLTLNVWHRYGAGT